MNPEVSVVMSVYNAGPWLRATVESVLAQTDVDFELIVIDDGSTDESAAILDAITDPRVRVVHQENRGLTRALITGCETAQGRLIARQDAGDLSLPLRLAKQRRALDADSSLAFVSCWTEYIGPQDEPLWTGRGTGFAAEPQDVLDATKEWGMADGPSHHGSVMFRAGAYRDAGGYRAEFRYGQDWDLWYRLAALGKFRMLAEPLYAARIEPSSISSAARRAQQALAALSLAAAKARAEGRSDAGILRQAATIPRSGSPLCAEARGLYFIGEALRRRGDARARGYFLRAIRSCPAHVKAWLRCAQTLLR